MGNLTEKQEKFCELYAKSGNALESARGAGYSENFANGRSGGLLKQPAIYERIKTIRERLNERADKSAVDVVNEFSVIAFSDHVGFIKEDPDYPGQWCYKAPNELTEEQRKCVEQVHIHKRFSEPDDKGNVVFIREEYSYTLLDKASALSQMGRHFGIFDDKLRLQTTSNQFKNMSTEKLLELKQAFASAMSGSNNIIEGQLIEHKK